MTREDWEKVEQALSGIYGLAKLRVDGHEVSFHRQLITKNQLGIVTFVDGVMRGECWDASKPYSDQRFWRPASRFVHKPAARDKLKKLWPRGRQPKGEYWNPNAKIHYFVPWWTNVAAIRRHYQKTFQSIELVEVVGC